MPALDMEAEYNNRARVPGHVAINERWSKASADFRRETKGEIDRSYGKGARHRYDLFHPRSGGDKSPLVVFIHGGYWQRGDNKMYSFLATELNGQGVSLALPTYSLAPAATVMEIVGEMRQFLKALYEATKRHPVVVGHSAGGHLAAAMLATDWSKEQGVPADLVRAAYAISGVFDLPPLIGTTTAEPLKLDMAKAREASPLFWPAPPRGRTFVAAAGGDESQEFIRQSLDIAAAWSKAGVRAECVVVPSANHFTIVDELGRPDSAMLARVVSMAKL